MTTFDLQSRRGEVWNKLVREAEGLPPSPDPLRHLLEELQLIERFWAYPGPQVLAKLFEYLDTASFSLFKQLVSNVYCSLSDKGYRVRSYAPFVSNLSLLDKPLMHGTQLLVPGPSIENAKKTYFEVLVVHPMIREYEGMYRTVLSELRSDRDEFIYDLVFVDSAQDAIAAVLSNPEIQCVVMVSGFVVAHDHSHPLATDYLSFLKEAQHGEQLKKNPLLGLSRYIRMLRPELDQFFISETPANQMEADYREAFSRILFHIHPFQDLHYHILNSVRERFSTPFFHALQAYSKKPRGMFHALPLSQAKSVQESPWTQDMLAFYGPNIFLAETSATQGGLDSLLDPKGTIKQAQEAAARAFDAEKTFFVTNGSSTANKIIMQATLCPSDIVLLSSDCHKSVPYAAILTGATPIFLETYFLPDYDLYGAVSLRRIKEVLLDLKAKGLLDRVKQITLTNSTFDGIIYNVARLMTEILAIKPDIIFHWDEAWFAFGHFNPLYRGRTGMSVAKTLKTYFRSGEYRQFYQNWKKTFFRQDLSQFAAWDQPLYPDPDKVVIRVYVTQSTHKTQTAFRQGSMIHIRDTQFNKDRFFEAYRMHTSTSPNYQILASLDVGRRQASLEGFEQVKRMLQLADRLRKAIRDATLLQPYFKILEDTDMVPEAFRDPGHLGPGPTGTYAQILDRWQNAEFVVDPTRITLDIRNTGIVGSSFRELLINRYNIQVNKTSHYTALFIVNIGSTEASIDYLIQVLHEIAARLCGNPSLQIRSADTIVDLPPDRHFHPAFRPFELGTTEAVLMREAYYWGLENGTTEYAPLDTDTLAEVLHHRKLVSAGFVTPYPPGFPILVPGQLITYQSMLYLQRLKIKEIHGYTPNQGLKVFKAAFLDKLIQQRMAVVSANVYQVA